MNREDRDPDERPGDYAEATLGEPEERVRYRELLEELRTILPGVQVLFAFLLTAPFSQRFNELDEFGRDIYTWALLGTALAAILFLAPASFHRVAKRRHREDRLKTGIRLMVAGMLVLAVSMLLAVFSVVRFLFGGGVATAAVAGLGAAVLLLWYLVPLLHRLGLMER